LTSSRTTTKKVAARRGGLKAKESARVNAKDCVSDRIKKVILERISDGTYAPGQRLIELQIAREFETSQAPIREAFCALEAIRVVETEPFKGTRVRSVSSDEINECLEIRGVLEQLAAEKIGDKLKDKLELLKALAQETVAAARDGDVKKYARANVEFHATIVEATENPTLIMVWHSLAPEVRMFASVYANAGNLPQCADEHMEIVEAFAEGDNRYAGKLLKKHTEKVHDHFEQFKDAGDGQARVN
jgi:DNA-binding GntR family transcriptional regulator